MKFAGIYKVSKVAKRTEDGFVFEDIEKRLAEATNPADKHMLEQSVRSLLMIDEDASLKHLMEIPEGTPAEELEKAKSRGMTVTDDGKYIVTKAEEGKFENDELYLHDPSTFLAGTEWVKISTDVEDELNLVASIYKRI